MSSIIKPTKVTHEERLAAGLGLGFGDSWYSPLGRLCKQKEFYSTCIMENIVRMTNLEMYLDAQTMIPTHFCPVQGFPNTEICQFWVKTGLMFFQFLLPYPLIPGMYAL
jgi:hypothetical protein